MKRVIKPTLHSTLFNLTVAISIFKLFFFLSLSRGRRRNSISTSGLDRAEDCAECVYWGETYWRMWQWVHLCGSSPLKNNGSLYTICSYSFCFGCCSSYREAPTRSAGALPADVGVIANNSAQLWLIFGTRKVDEHQMKRRNWNSPVLV